jgi:glycosyltransferase involved in cell wall biosynthesis
VRIAYVITRADAVGGASIHVRDLSRAMLERGHQVLVLTGGEGPVTEQLRSAGVPFLPLRNLRRPVRLVRDLRALAELSRALRDFQPDVVSLHTAKAGWIGRIAASRLSIPAVYTPHGWAFGGRFPAPARFAFHLAEKALASRAAAIVCVSRYERDLALRCGVAEAGRLRVIYNGVRDVAPGLLADPAASPVRFVSVARFQAPKDHETLLQALARIRAAEWQMDLVGNGPLLERTRRLAVSLGVAERVHFLGYQPDPERVLARAQVFVLSSRSEGLPRSVLEAMRAGLPVVASGVGGVPEAVSDGETGLLVPPGRPAELAAALRRVLDDRSLRVRLGAEARLAYEDRFGIERVVSETVSVYDAVLDS